MKILKATIKEAARAGQQYLEKQVIPGLKTIQSALDYAIPPQYFLSYFLSLEKTIAPYIMEEFTSRSKKEA